MNNIADKPQAQTGRSPDVPIRVVIIEDLREVRDGLAMLINGTSGFHCAGSYRTMEDALEGMAGAGLCRRGDARRAAARSVHRGRAPGRGAPDLHPDRDEVGHRRPAAVHG